MTEFKLNQVVVTVSIDILEKNGKVVPCGDLIIRNHGTRSKFVVLTQGKDSVTVEAVALEEAIKRCAEKRS